MSRGFPRAAGKGPSRSPLQYERTLLPGKCPHPEVSGLPRPHAPPGPTAAFPGSHAPRPPSPPPPALLPFHQRQTPAQDPEVLASPGLLSHILSSPSSGTHPSSVPERPGLWNGYTADNSEDWGHWGLCLSLQLRLLLSPKSPASAGHPTQKPLLHDGASRNTLRRCQRQSPPWPPTHMAPGMVTRPLLHFYQSSSSLLRDHKSGQLRCVSHTLASGSPGGLGELTAGPQGTVII